MLEEMSPAAELGPQDKAAPTSPGCQLTVKLYGRELPQMSESNEHPEQVSLASWGLVGQHLGGRSTDGQGCMDVVVSLSTYLLTGILVPVIPRCLHESLRLLSSVLSLEVVGIQKA